MTNLVQFPGLGLSFELDRVAFSIGGMNIYWYGVCIAVGMCLALVFAFRHSVEFGVDADAMVDVILIGVVMGILCARLYYVALSPYQYHSLKDVLAIRDGGLAIYGGIIGAFLFGGLACKWRKVPVLPMFDLAAMGFLIGQGCGRWGNFFNQEAFGCNTTLPWGMYSQATHDYLTSSVVTVPKGVTIDPNLPVHPTFLYESIWCFVGLFLLVRYIKKAQVCRRYRPAVPRLVRSGPLLDRSPPHRQPAAGAQHRPAGVPAGGRHCRGGRRDCRDPPDKEVQGQAPDGRAAPEQREPGTDEKAGRPHCLCGEGHCSAGLCIPRGVR